MTPAHALFLDDNQSYPLLEQLFSEDETELVSVLERLAAELVNQAPIVEDAGLSSALFARLLELLRHASAFVRYAALGILSYWEPEVGFSAISIALSDEDDEVFLHAVSLSFACLEQLVDVQGDESEESASLSTFVWRVLEASDERMEQVLVELVSCGCERTKANICCAIARRAPRTVGLFVQLLVQEELPALHVAVTEALLALGEPAMERLFAHVTDTYVSIDNPFRYVSPRQISSACAAFGEPALLAAAPLLRHQRLSVRRFAEQVIAASREEHFPLVLELLASSHRLTWETRKLLVSLGPSLARPLLAHLSKRPRKQRADLCGLFSEIGPGYLRATQCSDCLAVLLSMASDSSPVTRCWSLQFLSYFEDQKAVKMLLSRVEERTPQVRIAAVRAMRYHINEVFVEPLVRSLSLPDVELRREIVKALSAIATEETIEPLIRCLTDPDKEVYELATDALTVIDLVSAEEELMSALRGLLHLPASWDVRAAFMRLFKHWPVAASRDVALLYARQHVDAWEHPEIRKETLLILV
jgi:HEAT repeat protein